MDLGLGFNQAAIGMALVGLHGRFLRVNRALCDLLGRSEAELLGTGIAELADPEDVAALAELARVTAPGGTVVVEPLSARFVHEGWEPGRHLDRDGLRLDASYEVDGDLLVERLRWSLGGVEEAETYRQRLYSEAELEALLRAAGLGLAERRPMWPAIPAEPARGRTLWVAQPPG